MSVPDSEWGILFDAAGELERVQGADAQERERIEKAVRLIRASAVTMRDLSGRLDDADRLIGRMARVIDRSGACLVVGTLVARR